MKMEKCSPIQGENFIIFGEDFNRHPHALEHLLRPLFNDNKFIWVETIGLRSPKLSLYDLKRIVGKINKWINPQKIEKEQLPKNIIIVTPFMIPYSQFKIVRKFNQWQVKKNVRKVINSNQIKNPISIASVLNACDFVGEFDEKLKVYFCVDEFSLWPGLDTLLMGKLEQDLIQKSDVTIVTSDALASSKKRNNITPPIITHGVEFEHFNIGRRPQHSGPFKICYFGLFDERSNQEIIKAIAENVADCEVHIYGNVVCDIKNLKVKTNILFHGPVSYKELPEAIKDMDLFILPYYKNELTNFINPLKLKEYLSTGRPVVATDLPEVVKLQDLLYVGKNSHDFVETIRAIKEQNLQFDSDKVTAYVSEKETWKAKSLILSQILEQNLSS